jgi:pSer/pThr/pTyr-binding forkhead associated (FHA) protein
MGPELPRGRPAPVRRQATVLESVEDVRAQVRALSANEKEADQARNTQPYRPTVRPPMALLCVADDGDDAGEVIRVRGGSFVIGRVEGDLVIPHDGGISGRHAEISRRVENGKATWFLKDLQSTNGTFVRASTVVLHHDQELLIGGRRLRFDALPPSAGTPPDAEVRPDATRKWEALPPTGQASTTPSALVEVSRGGESRRFSLTGREHWLGRDPRRCSIVVDDPMVDPRHARVYRDESTGRWVIANDRSRNGLWARVHEVALGAGGYFQCGEQRFSFKAL